MPNRTCRKCGVEKPLAPAFFNQPKPGNWRHVCKVCMAENTARHYAEKSELKVETRKRYNENKANAEGCCTPHDIAVIRKTQNDQCFYCGIDLHGGGEKDHKTPLSKGGSNWPANMPWPAFRATGTNTTRPHPNSSSGGSYEVCRLIYGR